jgi:hypothetical protein
MKQRKLRFESRNSLCFRICLNATVRSLFWRRSHALNITCLPLLMYFAGPENHCDCGRLLWRRQLWYALLRCCLLHITASRGFKCMHTYFVVIDLAAIIAAWDVSSPGPHPCIIWHSLSIRNAQALTNYFGFHCSFQCATLTSDHAYSLAHTTLPGMCGRAYSPHFLFTW